MDFCFRRNDDKRFSEWTHSKNCNCLAGVRNEAVNFLIFLILVAIQVNSTFAAPETSPARASGPLKIRKTGKKDQYIELNGQVTSHAKHVRKIFV